MKNYPILSLLLLKEAALSELNDEEAFRTVGGYNHKSPWLLTVLCLGLTAFNIKLFTLYKNKDSYSTMSVLNPSQLNTLRERRKESLYKKYVYKTNLNHAQDFIAQNNEYIRARDQYHSFFRSPAIAQLHTFYPNALIKSWGGDVNIEQEANKIGKYLWEKSYHTVLGIDVSQEIPANARELLDCIKESFLNKEYAHTVWHEKACELIQKKEPEEYKQMHDNRQENYMADIAIMYVGKMKKGYTEAKQMVLSVDDQVRAIIKKRIPQSKPLGGRVSMKKAALGVAIPSVFINLILLHKTAKRLFLKGS